MIDIFGIFYGIWQFERYISNYDIYVNGTAVFMQRNDMEATLYEEGEFFLNTKMQKCHQNYHYKKHDNLFLIERNDGSALYEFTLQNTNTFPIEMTHEHICKNDIYYCHFIIESYNKFQIRYHVSGCKKNYKIIFHSYDRSLKQI
jgi:hypothetical protein